MLISELLLEYDTRAIGLPGFSRSGIDARDIILMVNDGCPNHEIANELQDAGAKISLATIASHIATIRKALSRALELDGNLDDLAAYLLVDKEELDKFMNVKGKQRVPSLRGEVRRMIQSGMTDPKSIIDHVKKWAVMKNIPTPTKKTLDAIVHAVRRGEFSLPALKGGRPPGPWSKAE